MHRKRNVFLVSLQRLYITWESFVGNDLFTFASAGAYSFLLSALPIVLMVLLILVRVLHTSPEAIQSLMNENGFEAASFTLSKYIEPMLAFRTVGIFEMIIGTQALWAPAALFGAKAMISGLANVYPELVVDFYETTIKEGIEAAAKIQPSILRARGVTRIGPTVPTCHAILELRGVEAGFPRKPFQPISDAEKECVRKALVAEGLL